jgi:Ca2+-binding RTX toxin-like protein
LARPCAAGNALCRRRSPATQQTLDFTKEIATMRAIVNDRSARTGRRTNLFENLEQRRLMSTTLVNGILTVTGTAGNDWLQAEQLNGEVYVFENGLLGGGFGGIFNASSVTKVVFNGLDGHDTLVAHSSLLKPTDMFGGPGDDSMYGNAMPNYMYGADGRDYAWCEAGNDSVAGGEGNDLIYLGAGEDLSSGNGGDDLIFGGPGNDYVYGEGGNDSIFGEDGNDTVRADAGDDMVYGGNGNDQVWGGWGNDRLFGEAGNDWLSGEDGYDTLNGGAGNDSMYGGNHNDFFEAFDDQWDLIDGGAGTDRAHCDKRPWWDRWQVQDSLYSIESSYE